MARNGFRVWLVRAAVALGVFCALVVMVYGYFCWAGLQVPINTQTTRALGPVGADGRIDYAAAIDAAYGAGVTAENNAAVLMLLAVGGTGSSEVSVGELLKRMGAEGADAGRKALVTTKVWAEGRGVDDGELDEAIDKAGETPWSAEQARGEFERVRAYLEENREALDLLVEAGKRERFWWPAVRVPGQSLLAARTEPMGGFRAAARMLAARAMMRVNDEPGLAVEDALTVIRLGRHLQGGSGLISYLVGTGMKSVGYQTMEGMLGELPEELVEKAAEATAGTNGTMALATVLDVGERYHCLESVLSIMPTRQGVPMQWGNAMRIINERFDELVAALKLTDRAQKKAAIEAMVKRIERKPGFVQMMNGGLLAEIMLPSLARSAETADRLATDRALLRVAIEVVKFERRMGRYPATLAEAGVGEVKDFITGAAVVYQPGEKGFVVYSVGKNGRDEGGQEEGDESVPRSQWPDDLAVMVR